MTRTQIAQFRGSLEAKRDDLLRSLRELRGQLVADNRGDNLDRVRKIEDREFALRSIERESRLLQRVEGALREIEEGTFGICAACDHDIPVRRLEAVPWSPYCVSCQEASEARFSLYQQYQTAEPYALAG